MRAIQEKEIRPVGSVKRVPINVRILAATNRDLERAVADGTFRRDLFFRLNVLTLRIPLCASADKTFLCSSPIFWSASGATLAWKNNFR